MDEKVIIDGGWGGDTMQLCATLLANNVDVLGTTTVFGNAKIDKINENAHDILHFLNADHVPIYSGAEKPSSGEAQFDGAHKEDGRGGARLETVKSRIRKPAKNYGIDNDGVNFILQTVEGHPGEITLMSSGPVTNIAQAIKLRPDIMAKVKQIVIMGGCTKPMKANDAPPEDKAVGKDFRSGNITRASEFNFNTAPDDAKTVMDSGLPIVLLPMNCTHKLTVTPDRQRAIMDALSDHPEAAQAVLTMMTAPADFDRRKFDIDPVMHDVNCALYLLHPELYRTEKGNVAVSAEPATPEEMARLPYVLGEPKEILGHTEFTADPNSKTTVAIGFKEPEKETADQLFDIYLNSLVSCISRERSWADDAEGQRRSELRFR